MCSAGETGIEVLGLVRGGDARGESERLEVEGRRQQQQLEQWTNHVALPAAPSSYLVDPASSHMLVSKIKPCMSKYKPI